MLVQVLHLVFRLAHRGNLALVAIEEAQQHRPLETRIARTVDAHAEAVAARTVDLLEVAGAHAQIGDVVGNGTVDFHGDAPLGRPDMLVIHALNRCGVLAARQLQRRHRTRVVDQVVA